MDNNALIRGVSSYHPEHKVDNEFFIEHFKKQGEDISGLLETTGRKSRYLSEDEAENIVTMGYQAAKKGIRKSICETFTDWFAYFFFRHSGIYAASKFSKTACYAWHRAEMLCI